MGGGDGILARTFDVVDEDLVTEHTVDVSRVVTEENTTEGGKGADHVGLEGDGSLDAVDIGCGLEDNGAARGRDVGGGARLLFCHTDD
jgi:hypothetical protein